MTRKSSQFIANGSNFAMDRFGRANSKKHTACEVNKVSVSELCYRIMETVKSKPRNATFKISSRMFHDTIRIFSEQVQDLYRTTFNLKQAVCRNTIGTTVNCSQLEDGFQKSNVDLQALFSELDNYQVTEEDFKLPIDMSYQMYHKESVMKNTLSQVDWRDCSSIEEDEEFFGEATPDELAMFLSFNTATSNNRKRKMSSEIDDSFEPKRLKEFENCDPTIVEILEIVNSSDFRLANVNQEGNGGIENGHSRTCCEIDGSDIDEADDPMLSEADSIIPKVLRDVSPSCNNWKSTSQFRKRLKRKRETELIIDRETKISKTDMDKGIDDLWRNCYDINDMEHVVDLDEVRMQKACSSMFSSVRHNARPVLRFFKARLKVRRKRDHMKNRELIIEGIGLRKTPSRMQIYKKSLNNEIDENNNADPMPNLNEHPFKDIYLDKTNSHETTTDDRQKWGRKDVLMRITNAWKTNGPQVPFSAIIAGLDRVKAAQIFCVVLELAGKQYIEIIKSSTNFIESIKITTK